MDASKWRAKPMGEAIMEIIWEWRRCLYVRV